MRSETDSLGPREQTSRPKRRRQPWIPPQNAVNNVWARFSVKIFSKATAVLPVSGYPQAASLSQGQCVATNFEEAAEACRQKVKKIVEEHRRVNQRYRDPHFDIDLDLKFEKFYCLATLTKPPELLVQDLKTRKWVPNPNVPQSVKRIHKIFEHPTFKPGEALASDIKQGKIDNCWLMASLTALANMPKMIERICVAHDSTIGVYGFLFYRDGEWISSIIDDNLYLQSADWDIPSEERMVLEKTEREDAEKEHLRTYQTGSKALWGGRCRNPNETWLPLLEKAFAKAHGDYYSLSDGWPGEGLEDLTGGVTTELLVSDILNVDDFWNNELKKVNEEFLFGCATGVLDRGFFHRQGIVEGHAYTIMEAKERKSGERLLKLRDPWGSPKQGLWEGAWSDGSKEWTAETLAELGHQQGIDSVCWISYEDFLRKFQVIDRTRLFLEPEWRLTQQWTSVDVPWNVTYHEKFRFSVKKDTPVVIILSQLDDRYFRGLEGQYRFKLHFRLHSQDNLGPENYIARSHGNCVMDRSVVADLPNLQAGTYSVFVKVFALRDTKKDSVERVVEDMCRNKTDNEKFCQVGYSYNMAHAKGASHMEAQMKVRMKEEEKKERRRLREASRRQKWTQGLIENKKENKPALPGTVVPTNVAKNTGDIVLPQPGNIPTVTPVFPPLPALNALPLRNAENAGGRYAPSKSGDLSSGPNISTTSEEAKTTRDQKTLSEAPPPPQQGDREIVIQANNFLTDQRNNPRGSSDIPADSDSEDGSDSDSDHQRDKLLALSYDRPDGDAADDDIDPWNAVCMVGLRLFSKDPDLNIEVIMPGKGAKAALDIDDKLADMTAQVNPEENKEKDKRPAKLKRAATCA